MVLIKHLLLLRMILMSLDIVVLRPSWQVMRVSCLKENNPYGGLLTSTGAEDAINRLNNYINNITDAAAQGEITRMQETTNEEVACRIYRVHNFLQTTVNGLRSQHLPHVEQIQNYVSQLSPQLNHSNVAKVANKWNWDVIRFELEDLWIKERSWFAAVLVDIEERIKEKHNDSQDLLYFHRLLLEVNS